MTERVYLTDSYLRSFEATVTSQDGSGVILDRTAFYPGGGGQPPDRGTLRGPDGTLWLVSAVEEGGAGLVHRLAGDASPPSEGARLVGAVDWTLRHRHMRYHTLLHLLSGVVFHRFGSDITGGQIYADRARMDFSLPDFSASLAADLLEEVNRRAAEDLKVEVRFVPRSRLTEEPSLVRVARHLLPEVDPVRLIDIGGFDVQADGGTHVPSTREVGRARVERLENKGARNKRLYLTLDDPIPRSGGGD